MNLYFRVLLLLVLLSSNALANNDTKALPDVESNEGWELQLDKDDIQIYTRDWPGSDFVAVKTVQLIQSSLSNIVANYLDVASYPEWVRDLRTGKLIRDFNDQGERIAYMRMDMPWPLQDRDTVIGQSVSQDPETLVVRVKEWNESRVLPTVDGVVRVPKVQSEFVLLPAENGAVKMVWQGHNEPGGIIPSFLVNWLIDNVFYESCLNMRERFESPEYSKTAPDIIDTRIAQKDVTNN